VTNYEVGKPVGTQVVGITTGFEKDSGTTTIDGTVTNYEAGTTTNCVLGTG
jgi:hypothetical protein